MGAAGPTILQDLVVVMVVGAAATILFYRLKLPVVLGYLLAGLIIGPASLGLIHATDSIHGLADLGIIFLMFAVGLEFDLKKLRKVGFPAAFVAAVEVLVMLAVGYYTGRWMGWSEMDSIFLGAIISISSTTIIVKILSEMGKLKEDYSELAFGILIIEDILAIVLVALLTAMGTTGTLDAGLVPGIVGSVVLFSFIFIAMGLVLVPRLIDGVSRFHVEEVLIITVVGLAFAAALLANNLGFSLALGAFLMGAIIAESKAVRRVEHKIVPIRDLFTAMFFVAIGMLIEPAHLVAYWFPIVLVAVATVVGKIVSVAGSAYLVGNDGRTSMKTAAALGQIGEFSFIIAGLGLSMGVVREELPPVAIAVCAITSLATPAMMKYSSKTTDWVSPRLPRWYARATEWYTAKVRRLISHPSDPMRKRDTKRSRHGTRVAIYAAWLFGLLISAAYASQWLGAEVGEALSLGDNATRAAAIGFLGLAALPLFVAFTKATEAYTLSAAKERAMNPRNLSKADARHRRPKFIARAVAAVASIVLVAGAVRVAWGVHPLAIPNTWALVPILLVVAIVGALFWRRLERLYVGMEKTLNELMGTEDDTVPDDQNKRLRERLPWGMDLEDVRVHSFSRAAYTSLKSLNLRDMTGATVLSIERGQTVVPNPHADMVLLPHDRIILVGKHEHLEKARSYLNAATPHDDVVSVDLRIPASSPGMGHTLGELDLPGTTGARLGFIQKRDGSLVAPSPRVQLEPDDHIFVYGSESSIDRTRERLKAQRWGEPPRPKFGPGR